MVTVEWRRHACNGPPRLDADATPARLSQVDFEGPKKAFKASVKRGGTGNCVKTETARNDRGVGVVVVGVGVAGRTHLTRN